MGNTEITEDQIVEETVRVLLMNHLNECDSESTMPSRDVCNSGRNCACEMVLEMNYTLDELQAMGDEFDIARAKRPGHALYERAAQIADAKWQAVMTLLALGGE